MKQTKSQCFICGAFAVLLVAETMLCHDCHKKFPHLQEGGFAHEQLYRTMTATTAGLSATVSPSPSSFILENETQ